MSIRPILVVAGLMLSGAVFAQGSAYSAASDKRVIKQEPVKKHRGHSSAAKKPTACEKVAMSCAKTVSSAVNDSGRIWSSWVIGEHLYLNYSDDLGRTYSAPMQVNPSPEKISTRGENRPKIALDKLGNVYLSWVMPLSKRFTADVRFSYWSGQTQEFSKPITINNDGLLTGHSFNEMVVSDQGDIFISWLDGRAKVAAAKQGIRLRTSELYLGHANFVTGDDEFSNTYLSQGTCVCCRLAMDLDDKDLPLVMWRHVFGDNYRDHAFISMQSKIQPNKMQRVSFENWQVDGCPHQGPSIVRAKAGNNSNRVHMSWFNNAPDASGLFYSYSDDNGQTMAKVNHFATKSTNPEHPFLSQNQQGRIELVWREFNGSHYQIKYMSSARGDSWSGETTIAMSETQVDYPYILNHPSGSYLHWHNVGQPLELIKL